MTSNIQKSNAKWLERDYNKEKKKRADMNLKNFRNNIKFTNVETPSSIKLK